MSWLLIPLGWAAWHYGPGQQYLKADEAARAVKEADKLAQQQEWFSAEQWYEDALRALPEDRVAERRKLQLAIAKVQIKNEKLPVAHQQLKSLVEELASDSTTEPVVLADARASLAYAQYYMTWLMRLEGQPEEEWQPEIDSSRQIYRLLAEQASARGDITAAEKAQEDLEAAIRLARMDLNELQGIALPKQCCCCSGKCKSKGKGKVGQKPKDARGASTGPPPDDGGH
jgi:tetratricopeptide (TPR) repeat protein